METGSGGDPEEFDAARPDGLAPRRRDRNVGAVTEFGRQAIPIVDRTLASPGERPLDGTAAGGGRHIGSSGPSASVRRHRWVRRMLRGASVAALGLLVYGLVSLVQVWSTGRADDRGPVDAIVVMGAAQYDGRPSPQLAARLDHVLELWPEGTAPLIVVTGGNIPGDRFTEAQASAEYLIERGVPESALVYEDDGSNSYESLESVAAMLSERGMSEVVIVTDPFHSLRSKLIAEELGLDASVSATETSVVSGTDSAFRHVKEAGGVAVGRVIGFDRLTDITG